MERKLKVFVVGWDEFNYEKLTHLPEAGECQFLPAICFSEMRGKNISIPDLLDIAEERIKKAGKIDALVTFYDFPGTVLTPIIARKFDLPAPSLQHIMKCEHKYWSRLEQQKVIPENIPAFKQFDLYDDNAYDKIGFKPPFWIKPVKSYHSYLSYKITDRKKFEQSIVKVRKGIDSIIEPFAYIIKNYGIDGDVSGLKEKMFAETVISGHQCTAEGYAYNGEIRVYGVVDSIRVKGGSSFVRYQYPSSLAADVKNKINELSKEVIRQIGLMNSPFNIEYFYNEKSDRIYLLEINPRISQAHTDLFEKVHGISNHEVMLNIALNRQPAKFEHKGEFKVAAHFMHRSFKPGIIREVPSEKEIAALKKKYPDMLIQINIEEGLDLDEMATHHIDSYSYILANIFLGGRNTHELLDKYRYVIDNLTIRIDYHETTG